MNYFERAFAHVIGVEGKYSNHPLDKGGETMFGITIAKARAHGYTGPMRLLPIDVAHSIYKIDFWDKLNLDQVAQRSYRIALELFDTGVNMGEHIAGVFLQSSLNLFNRNQKDYKDIEEDGKIGPKTLTALDALLKKRKLNGEILLLKDLNVQQGYRYRTIAKANRTQEEFMVGWYDKRISIPYVGG